jgi:hypothetical protein
LPFQDNHFARKNKIGRSYIHKKKENNRRQQAFVCLYNTLVFSQFFNNCRESAYCIIVKNDYIQAQLQPQPQAQAQAQLQPQPQPQLHKHSLLDFVIAAFDFFANNLLSFFDKAVFFFMVSPPFIKDSHLSSKKNLLPPILFFQLI